jgi:hypothetical protein
MAELVLRFGVIAVAMICIAAGSYIIGVGIGAAR